jgi:hemin uptake protein HemP
MRSLPAHTPVRASVHSTLQPEATSIAHTASGPAGCLDSTEILRGQKTVAISHNGATYRLQATRLGKLILTK